MKKVILLSSLLLSLCASAQHKSNNENGIKGSAIGDVVITEIMADPSPPVQLPAREYLEITNRTADSISLEGWMLIATNDSSFLPRSWIRPDEYIILCSSSGKTEFSSYGRVICPPSFPGLNDGGEIIALRDKGGSLVHAVSYTPELFNDGLRSGGGWSVELADMTNPFNEPDAWRASVDPSGGTPGRLNSTEILTEDLQCPEVIAVWPAEPDKLKVLFDETIINAEGEMWLINGEETLPTESGDMADHTVLIPLKTELKPGAVSSLLIPPAVTDFAGNSPCVTELKTGLPSDPSAGEILFNEILFDPATGCQDYIELYNNSDMVFDLSQLFLANGSSTPAIVVSSIPRQLLPRDYVALTTDRESVAANYRCAGMHSLFEISDLPSMPDDEGSLVLYDKGLNIIDRFDYNSSMHLLFLSGKEGVALEKVAPDLPSGIAGNWHSASEDCGWGTPGTENSNLLSAADEGSGMTLSSSRVSPDCDGFEDVVSVDVFPGGNENVVTVTVFSDRGYIVRRLAERFAAGEGTRFVWDGTSDDGARLPAGLYLIIAESFNTDGESRRWKKVCALVYR